MIGIPDYRHRMPLYSSFGASAILSDIITFPKAFDFVKLSASYAEVGNGGQAQIRFNTFGYSQGAGNGFISRSGIQGIFTSNLKL